MNKHAADVKVFATVEARDLADMLHACAGRVTLRLKDAGAPVLISDDDESVTRVLMPMRV